MTEAKKELKNKKFWSYIGVVALVLVAVIIALLFYRQKIEVTRDVFKKITENWQTTNQEFWGDGMGISFKYPKDWQLAHSAGGVGYANEITCDDLYSKTNKKEDNTVRVCLSPERVVDQREPIYAIQISIPFDKRNYLIFSTSTNNEFKEEFYNIPVTLEMGKIAKY